MNSNYQDIHKYFIERSLTGDVRAQHELYKLYAKAMYNICRRMLGNEEDAKDALQDSFIDAFDKLKTFRFQSSFGAWLKRIVINHCLNDLRKKKHLSISIDEAFDKEEEDVEASDIEYEVAKVLKAVDQLSHGCRTVLNLYLFEGYDHKEIAEILSITESASKAQYSKAKKKIRKIIGINN